MGHTAAATLCTYCQQPALRLSEFVWWCWRCQVGHSTYEYDEGVYNAEYHAEYARRGLTDVGQRITLARLGMISTFLPFGSRIVDFGCGSGEFIELARRHYRVLGVESTEKAAHTAMAASEVEVDTFDTYMQGAHDVDAITFHDSLEHVPDIHGTFDKLLTTLKPGGTVLITMPELPYCFASSHEEAYLSPIFARWRHNKPKEHLTYFTRFGLERFTRTHGLEHVLTSHSESYLRFDAETLNRNIMTVVARKLEC